MGSMGWAPCYWCGWWEYNPYIPDPLTHPLCAWCLQSACKKNEQLKGQLPMREQNKLGQLSKQLFMIALVENNLDGKIKKTKRTRWDWMLKESTESPRSLSMKSMKRP